jgi:hypothetical protein
MELIVNKKYVLTYTGAFCNRFTRSGSKDFYEDLNDGDEIEAIYIGRINWDTHFGDRDIFYDPDKGQYIMFSCDTFDHAHDRKSEMDTIKLKVTELTKKGKSKLLKRILYSFDETLKVTDLDPKHYKEFKSLIDLI